MIGYFFSFLCIWDVTYLNCHLISPIFSGFFARSSLQMDGGLCELSHALCGPSSWGDGLPHLGKRLVGAEVGSS